MDHINLILNNSNGKKVEHLLFKELKIDSKYIITFVIKNIELHFLLFLEGEEYEVDRTDDKTKSSINEELRLRLGSAEHGQNHLPQYRLNNHSSHKTYKGKQKNVDAESSQLVKSADKMLSDMLNCPSNFPNFQRVLQFR